MVFYLSGEGRFKGEFIREEDGPKPEAFQMWGKLPLDKETREQFEREAEALIHKYQKLSMEPDEENKGVAQKKQKKKTHLFHLAVAPTETNEPKPRSPQMRKKVMKKPPPPGSGSG